jgi:Flp pilus assembly protein TadD
MPDMIANLESMLAAGRDNALLRFTLGSHYLKSGETERAIGHLREAVRMDPGHSAAWKAYGKALVAAEDLTAARDAYVHGIEVAGARGDMQAVREMQVFLRRVEKQLGERDA